MSRAREAAEQAGAAVEWVCGDALQTPFPAGSFDLVSLQIRRCPKRRARLPCGRCSMRCARAGCCWAVYDDLDDEHREHMKSRGTDPADYVDADGLARLLGEAFTIERHAVEPRVDPPPDTPHLGDVVLRARRR